eukprot:TRINITY_DN13583_c0_g1_i1.p2 TRINITY_DN13583_c0_g1~~TRINITY_DN13583_c0_g1_i1.p2  ORF type:complete len:131 (+),score=18.52 TRINITY_DN13583_c0_g1_i1:327-719(+)
MGAHTHTWRAAVFAFCVVISFDGIVGHRLDNAGKGGEKYGLACHSPDGSLCKIKGTRTDMDYDACDDAKQLNKNKEYCSQRGARSWCAKYADSSGSQVPDAPEQDCESKGFGAMMKKAAHKAAETLRGKK